MDRDVTVRQIVHLSAGGSRIRVRFSNLAGATPLVLTAHVALAVEPGSPATRAGTDRSLAFAAKREASIPAGQELLSDPVDFIAPAGSDLTVSIHLADVPEVQTSHSGARATSFAVKGERSGAIDLREAIAIQHWFFVSGVEVESKGGTLVVIGDSITGGHGSTTDGNDRWPDVLAERFRTIPALADRGVANAGIGGNRVLADGIGPRLIDRFDRDVLGQAGVRAAIVMEGINDLGVMTRDAAQPAEVHRAMVDRIEAAFRDLAAKAHRHNIKLIGGTITPFVGSDYYRPGAETEADRQAINAFIRTSGTFDAIVDFDAALRDPAHPDRLLPAYDSGDHLHPSVAGYRAMAEAVPLALFTPQPAADAPAIALTIDDMPAHGPLPPGVSRLDVADAIIAALQTANTPAFGFVNGGFGADDPQSPAVLAHWRAAGFPLGNHTFDHSNLDQIEAGRFIEDVRKNEATIAPLMAGEDWRWFRYPFLAEGNTTAKRDTVRAWLSREHYRLAAVTQSFADYSWNSVYAACAARGEETVIAMLERSFLDSARLVALHQRDLARDLYRRDVPQVLLLHLGAFSARMMPRLLDQYRALGFRLVSLAEAESDPYYRAATDPRLPGPTPTLEAAAAAAGVAVPPIPIPEPAATLCG